MRRTLVVLVAVSLLTIVGAPSRAATPCPTGKFCVWADANKSGPGMILGINHHRVSNAIGNVIDNAVSSSENQTAFVVRLYENRNGKGFFRCMAPGDSINDFSTLSFNDAVSSSRVLRQGICL